MTIQRFIKRGTASNATARRLIESASVAPHIRRATVEDARIEQPVMRCRAEQAALLAGIVVMPGQHFYLVASRFAGRFYVVIKTANGWQCSSEDATTQARCIREVKDYRRQLLASQAA